MERDRDTQHVSQRLRNVAEDDRCGGREARDAIATKGSRIASNFESLGVGPLPDHHALLDPCSQEATVKDSDPEYDVHVSHKGAVMAATIKRGIVALKADIRM